MQTIQKSLFNEYESTAQTAFFIVTTHLNNKLVLRKSSSDISDVVAVFLMITIITQLAAHTLYCSMSRYSDLNFFQNTRN